MVLTLSLSTFNSYAAVKDDSAQPITVNQCVISFTAISSTSARAHVYGRSSNGVEFIKSKITLQSAPKGSSSYSNVSGVDPEIYTVYDSLTINHLCTFPITSSKNYRIKVELTDKVNGKQYTVTKYQALT